MKKFFAKIVGFLHILFGGNLDAWIMEHVQPSIEFVEKFKDLINCPAANVFTALFPVAKKLRDIVSANLSKALDQLFGGTHIEAETDLTNKILKALDYVRDLPGPMRAAAYGKLASLLTRLSAGNVNLEKVKNHSVDLLVQMQYSKLKENATADSVEHIEATDEPEPKPVEDPASQETPVIDTELLAKQLADPEFVSKLTSLLSVLQKSTEEAGTVATN